MPEDEQWTPVPGYKGLYEVSDQGRVRSLDRPHQGGRVLRPDCSGEVPAVWLSKNGTQQKATIPRLVLLAHGPDPDAPTMQATRVDKEKGYTVENLEWKRPITQAQLTEKEALVIWREAWGGSATQKDIAARYGVSRQTVSHIKHGRVWDHATPDTPPTSR